MTKNLLRPGPDLDELLGAQMDAFTYTLRKAAAGGAHSGKLLAWLGQTFFLANARSFYGPENPFASEPELLDAFIDWEGGLLELVVSPAPWLTARKACAGREKLVAAMLRFFDSGRHQQASRLVQERTETSKKFGLSNAEIARSELMLLFAVTANAMPVAFWMLCHAFTDPNLLAALRKQIADRAVSADGNTRYISAAALKRACPLLVSTYRETLRVSANLASVRFVREDIWVADQYLLKKGAIVQVAGGQVHHEKEIWGADADVFRADRFMEEAAAAARAEGEHDQQQEDSGTEPRDGEKKTERAVPRPKNVPAASFRAFGGGMVICPGRHFAVMELIGFVATVLLTFDISETDGSALLLPEKNNCKLPLGSMKPVKDPRVTIQPRQGMEHLKWDLIL